MRSEMRAEALRDAQFGSLEPGRFRTFGGGNVVFYAERVDDNHILHNVNVFVDRTRRAGQTTAASSRSGSRPAPSSAARDRRSRRSCSTTASATRACRAAASFSIIQFSEGGYPIRLGELSGRTPARRS